MQEGNYVQCQNCGHIYYTSDSFSIEEFVVKSRCPICKNDKGINCGKRKEDVYIYANINISPRYYLY